MKVNGWNVTYFGGKEKGAHLFRRDGRRNGGVFSSLWHIGMLTLSFYVCLIHLLKRFKPRSSRSVE